MQIYLQAIKNTNIHDIEIWTVKTNKIRTNKIRTNRTITWSRHTTWR